MSIVFKWVAWLVLLGLLMLTAFLWSNQNVLQQTILHSIDQRDQQRLERLANNLVFYFEHHQLESADAMPEALWLPMLRLSNRIDFEDYPTSFSDMLQRLQQRTRIETAFEQQVSLLNAQGQYLFGGAQAPYQHQLILQSEDRVWGQLGYQPSQTISEQADIAFAQRQTQLMLWGALWIVLFSVLLIWPITRHFLQPIRQMQTGLSRLASGDLSYRWNSQRRDEFGQLSQDFNHLAQSLQAAQQARQRWVADTSHDLRTPITVLRTSLESMLDGVREPSEKHLQAVYDEVLWLNSLVEDLQQLAQQDVGSLHYQMQRLVLDDWLDPLLSRFRLQAQQKGLDFSWQYQDDKTKKVQFKADVTRLTQMLTNLLQNTLDYSDAVQQNGERGQVLLTLWSDDDYWYLRLQDSEPGVDDFELNKLTQRFYRADSARCRQSGGHGLGLAIAERILQAHQGRLSLSASSLGGLCVEVSIPLVAFKQDSL